MANIRASSFRNFPTVAELPAHDRTMVLACYGPSLKRTMGDLSGGDLFTVSGAHQFLIDRGHQPIGHVEADPRPIATTRFGKPKDGIHYFISSACPPEMFEILNGYPIQLFNVKSYAEENQLLLSLYTRSPLINCGSNVGIATLALGYTLGYRKFIVHGMDCSFEIDKEILLWWSKDESIPQDLRDRVSFHAGPHPHETEAIHRLWLCDRPYLTSPQMVQGAHDFILLKQRHHDCQFQLRGDGLLVNMCCNITMGGNSILKY